MPSTLQVTFKSRTIPPDKSNTRHGIPEAQTLRRNQQKRTLRNRMLSGTRRHEASRGNNDMAFSHSDHRNARLSIQFAIRSMISLILCAVSAVLAQAQNVPPNSSEESWTAATQTSIADTNPLRTMESHSKSGNRQMDKQKVEVLGPDGSYQPSYETDTETIHVNDATTRTVVRTYKWDANGQKTLTELTEEQACSSASGDAQSVRTTSTRDANGNLQLVQREVADTNKTSPDAQEKKTTIYLADGNGGFTPSRQTEELQKSGADHSVEMTKTILVPGANGNWQVDGATEKTITEDGKNRTSDERVSRADVEGRLSEVSRTVDKETETAAGEKSNTVETYSADGAGVVVDGRLHLNQRVTTVQTDQNED